MAEQVESICIPFTHTYDQFTTFFYDGRVYLSDTSYPIGQCCVDIVNMDEEVLSEIDRCVEEFIPAARKLLMEKTNSAVAFAQEMLKKISKENMMKLVYSMIAVSGILTIAANT